MNTTLSARVGNLNPAWNAPDKSEELEMEQFRHAMLLCGEEFTQAFEGLVFSWLPARAIVEQAVDASTNVHTSGEVGCGCLYSLISLLFYPLPLTLLSLYLAYLTLSTIRRSWYSLNNAPGRCTFGMSRKKGIYNSNLFCTRTIIRIGGYRRCPR